MKTHDSFAPIAGQPFDLAPQLSLLLAPNPSPMTYLGTNTYLLGTTQLAIIDPGPNDPTHLHAILSAVNGRSVSHIIVTHSHKDHSALAPALSQATQAPVYAFGNSVAGRSSIMTQLTKTGFANSDDGTDTTFSPDCFIAHGDTLKTGDWALRAIHSPGHLGNHMCFQWQNSVFCGDHVMGWASSVVSPPDGDLTDFMQTCRHLQTIPADVFYPGHGAPIRDPHARLQWLLSHRQKREDQIIAALSQTARDIAGITAVVYRDLETALHPIAQRNVFAHLIDLFQRNKVQATPELSTKASFSLKI